MSAWPQNPHPSLRGTEGELVSVRIAVEPRLLEKLLDVLARLSFPINPQLYHGPNAASTTLVEFPAWAGRVREIEEALAGAGFESACLGIRDMLADIHSEAVEAVARYKAAASPEHPLRAIA